jgi:hypothetical protein
VRRREAGRAWIVVSGRRRATRRKGVIRLVPFADRNDPDEFLMNGFQPRSGCAATKRAKIRNILNAERADALAHRLLCDAGGAGKISI